MSQNFQKAKIYKITNDYNDEVYIGSTCDSLIKRFSKHKRDKKSDVNKNRPLYMLINDIGIERFRIDLIEDYPCNNKQALRQREGHFIREMGTLNRLISGRTKKEWIDENADKIKENKNKWREENADKVYEGRKKWRELNKEEINRKQKERRKKLEKENVAIY